MKPHPSGIHGRGLDGATRTPAVEPSCPLEFSSRVREQGDEQMWSCLGIRFAPANHWTQTSAKGANAGLRQHRWALTDSRRLATCMENRILTI
jgi:hypothetical protein